MRISFVTGSKRTATLRLCLMLLLCTGTVRGGNLRLPSVVGSNMVLQQRSEVTIWGWAEPGAAIEVSVGWNDRTVRTKADVDGKWRTAVHTPSASFDEQTVTIVSGDEKISLDGILIGEVWLCAGQSNMEFPVWKTTDVKRDFNKPMNRHIRLFCTGRIAAADPQEDIPRVKWTHCDRDELAVFSAVGFAFGRDLYEALHVPVGLIDASYGGTYIEGWVSRGVIEGDARIRADAAAITDKWAGRACALYNANIAPIENVTVAGTIWYQGCNNATSEAYDHYGHSLELLIADWRAKFRNPEMPFYIVQIVPHVYDGLRGALVREAQADAAKRIPGVEVVVTNDQTDLYGDIHPRNKAVIARRLADCALGAHYGLENRFRSPVFDRMEIADGFIRVSFGELPTTLVVRDEPLRGFQVYGRDAGGRMRCFRAQARLDATEMGVEVSTEGVAEPVGVRYCFNEEVGNLFSAEGLPVGSFRTDRDKAVKTAPKPVGDVSPAPIRFEGRGYVKGPFERGVRMWPNLKSRLDYYPEEFEGFCLLTTSSVRRNTKSPGGTITALDDGRIYILARMGPEMREYAPRYGWNPVPYNLVLARYEDGRPHSGQVILYTDVVKGEVVKLPVVSDAYSVMVLGREIDYAEPGGVDAE